jgi:hypothetical protein
MALGLLGALGVVGFGSSGEGQNRTADTAIFSRVLCQLSYLALSQARLGRSNENKALSVRAGRLLASMRPAPVEQPGVLISLSRRRPPVQIRSGAPRLLDHMSRTADAMRAAAPGRGRVG